MKKSVSDYIKSFGCKASYSGNTKTMHISYYGHGINPSYSPGHVEVMVIEEFGYGLPFKVSAFSK